MAVSLCNWSNEQNGSRTFSLGLDTIGGSDVVSLFMPVDGLTVDRSMLI